MKPARITVASRQWNQVVKYLLMVSCSYRCHELRVDAAIRHEFQDTYCHPNAQILASNSSMNKQEKTSPRSPSTSCAVEPSL